MSYSLTVAISEARDSAVRLVDFECNCFEDVMLCLTELESDFYIHAFSCVRIPLIIKGGENSCPAENM